MQLLAEARHPLQIDLQGRSVLPSLPEPRQPPGADNDAGVFYGYVVAVSVDEFQVLVGVFGCEGGMDGRGEGGIRFNVERRDFYGVEVVDGDSGVVSVVQEEGGEDGDEDEDDEEAEEAAYAAAADGGAAPGFFAAWGRVVLRVAVWAAAGVSVHGWRGRREGRRRGCFVCLVLEMLVGNELFRMVVVLG